MQHNEGVEFHLHIRKRTFTEGIFAYSDYHMWYSLVLREFCLSSFLCHMMAKLWIVSIKRDPSWPSVYGTWRQTWGHRFKFPLDTHEWIGLFGIYKCAVLWRAVYSASATTTPLIHREKGISSWFQISISSWCDQSCYKCCKKPIPFLLPPSGFCKWKTHWNLFVEIGFLPSYGFLSRRDMTQAIESVVKTQFLPYFPFRHICSISVGGSLPLFLVVIDTQITVVPVTYHKLSVILDTF